MRDFEKKRIFYFFIKTLNFWLLKKKASFKSISHARII